MSDDVTIPRETAKWVAGTLRMVVEFGDRQASDADLRRWADLLDPPAASLRDEVADLITERAGTGPAHDPLNRGKADLVLAVVRKRMEALPAMHVPNKAFLARDAVLALLDAR